MPIYYDKKARRWRYEFTRVVGGRRHRHTKLLPLAWNRAQAEAFDRAESARLYAAASGIGGDAPSIETAVRLYLTDKVKLKSYKQAAEHLAAILTAYEGRTFADLPGVVRTIIAEGQAPQAPRKPGGEPRPPLAPATIRQRIALLRAACRWGWKHHGMGETDPGQRLMIPAVRNERHEYASRAEMLRIARAMPNRSARGLLRLAFYTGFRRGELWACTERAGALWLPDTKSGEPRAVPVHARARVCLRYLPPTISRITLTHYFKRAARAAELGHLRLHDMRHSTASAMVQEGVDLYTVGAVLGHADPRSTRRYAHLAQQQLADAIARIGGQKSPHSTRDKAA